MSESDLWALAALAISVAAGGVYLCRLDLLGVGTHRLWAIVVYYAGFAAAVLVGAWAAFGHAPDARGWMALLASGVLLAYRWSEWGADRTPQWTRKG